MEELYLKAFRVVTFARFYYQSNEYKWYILSSNLLYESVWNITGVIILLVLRKVDLKRGEIFLTYLLWYSVGRFL